MMGFPPRRVMSCSAGKSHLFPSRSMPGALEVFGMQVAGSLEVSMVTSPPQLQLAAKFTIRALPPGARLEQLCQPLHGLIHLLRRGGGEGSADEGRLLAW